jgi:tRNA (guanine26-N2/guanine27-N2)-dimethyltransferase
MLDGATIMENLVIDEGHVKIKVPPFDKISSKAPVFYNPAMELNRDLSVAAITVFQTNIDQELQICDAFGGTGIRGIRYAREIEGIKCVVINDMNPLAVQLARENISANELNNITVCREDANLLLRRFRGKFQVVDVDPFGTPAPYLESAAISLKSSGLICVTATDTSALCGTYPASCIRKYGALPLKTEYCHELGLRILAGFVSRTFARYRKSIRVKFSHSTEHYLRLYATIEKGAKKTDKSLENLGYIAHCQNCLNRVVVKGIAPHIPQECPICQESFHAAGPLWCGEIADADFIDGMLNILPQLKINKEKEAFKILETCYGEAEGPSTHYDLHKICKKLKISAPPLLEVLEKLRERGYFASRTHFRPTALKTDASIDIVKKIVLSLKQ